MKFDEESTFNEIGRVVSQKKSNDDKYDYTNSFFAYISMITKVDSISDPTLHIPKAILVITHIFYCLQMTSLLWNPGFSVAEWYHFEGFWLLMSFARFDILCSNFQIIEVVLLCVNCLLLSMLGLFLVSLVLVFYHKEPFSILNKLQQKLIYAVSTLFFVPILAMLLIDIKYYFSGSPKISEYSASKNSYSSQFTLALNILTLFSLFWFNFIYEYFTFEIRHIHKDKLLLAKASASIDINAKLLGIVVVTLYTFVLESHVQLCQVIFLLIFSYNTLQYFYFLPYFSNFTNKVKVATCIAKIIITLAFLVGFIINDARTILFLCIVIVPFGCYIMVSLVDYRVELVKAIDPETCSNTYLELYYREKLSDTKHCNKEILSKFDKSQSNSRGSEMVSIWKTYYCLDVLDDVRLAFIKFSKAWSAPFSLALMFQRFKCNALLSLVNFEQFEDLNYMRYALKFERLKALDKNLSLCMLQFWGELVSNGNISKLTNLATQGTKGISKVKEGYEHLISTYFSSNKCQEFYKSFLIDISCDVEERNLALSKMNTKKEIESQGLNYFDDNNGIILVSGNRENIGEILYANTNFYELIGESQRTVLGSNISTFIPDEYSRNHNKSLLNFVEFTLDSEVPFSGSLFLQTESGYLVEAAIKSRCLAIEGNVFFLALIKKVVENRHIMLVSSKGLIYAYNLKLAAFLSITNLKMLMIDDIFSINFEEVENNRIYIINYKLLRIGLIKSYRQVGNTFMPVVLLYENVADMNSFEEFEELNNEEYKISREPIELNPRRKEVSYIIDTGTSHPMLISQQNIETIHYQKRPEKYSQSSNSITSKNVKHSKKIMEEAVRGIRIFKWILLISVLIAIATSITIFSRVYVDVTNEMQPNVTIFLGSVIESIISISYSVRMIELQSRVNRNFTIYNEIYAAKLNSTVKLYDDLGVYKDLYWSDCEAANFIKDNILPVVKLNVPGYFVTENLYDFLGEFLESAQGFQIKLLKKKDFSQEFYFLVANGGKVVLENVRRKAEQSVQCSIDRAKNVNWTKNVILYIGIAAMTLTILSVTFFVISLSKKINQLWTFLSSISLKSYRVSKGVYTSRLLMVNDLDEWELTDTILKENPKSLKFSITFSQIWNYMWRLFIFSFVSVGFYLIVTVVYCSDIERTIVARSDLAMDFSRKNYLLFSHIYYIIESAAQKYKLGMNAYFPKMVFLADPNQFIRANRKAYNFYKNDIKNPELTRFMPANVYSLIFERCANQTSDIGYNKIGLYSALEYTFNNDFYELNTTGLKDYANFTAICNQIFNDYQYINSELDKSLNARLSATFNSVVIITVIYAIFSILLFVGLYLPYLQSEINKLIRIQSLAKLLINVDN